MNQIKLALIQAQLYALEIHIAGCDECLECVSDPKTINRIHDARLIAKRELHRLRATGCANIWQARESNMMIILLRLAAKTVLRSSRWQLLQP